MKHTTTRLKGSDLERGEHHWTAWLVFGLLAAGAASAVASLASF